MNTNVCSSEGQLESMEGNTHIDMSNSKRSEGFQTLFCQIVIEDRKLQENVNIAVPTVPENCMMVSTKSRGSSRVKFTNEKRTRRPVGGEFCVKG